ncbi:MAG: hypothetical protein JNJ94_07625 [Chlorobi bacterium]|nr:hypothetical protein [Chlorobiota bacterium]
MIRTTLASLTLLFCGLCCAPRYIPPDAARRTLATVQDQWKSVRWLTLYGKINYYPDSTMYYWEAYITNNDSLKVVLNNPKGGESRIICATPDRFLYFNTRDSVAYEGEPTAEAFQVAMWIPLGFRQMVAYFRNQMPVVPRLGQYDASISGSRISYFLPDDPHALGFTIDTAKYDLLSVGWTPDLRNPMEVVSLTYNNYMKLNHRRYARWGMIQWNAPEGIPYAGKNRARYTVQSQLDTIKGGRQRWPELPATVVRRRL